MRNSFCCKFIFCVIAFYFSITGTDSLKCLSAQEIGFLEDFVMASDREKVLKQLVPGTEKYYYFHSLHYQNAQQLDKVDGLLESWLKRHGKTSRYNQILNRQSLLKYSDDPEATLDYLKKKLKLHFSHQQRIPDAQRELPSKLDPNLYATETLLKEALQTRSSGTSLIKDKGLSLLAGKDLSKSQRRDLLKRLQRPDFPDLVDLIITDMQERDSGKFGSLPIHKSLTIKQLSELSEKYPKVKLESKFVGVYLSKLLPSEDVNWRANADEHRNYLDRLWAFVKPLNANFNSLKASVLYRLLELNLREEKMDRDLFMAYLALPRNTSYIHPVILKNVASRSHIVKLTANYSSRCYLEPINDDESLVRKYLHHFLVDAADHADFDAFVKEPWLKREFALAKILNGIGDVEQWASRLTPDEYEKVLKRVDVEFVSTNPEFFNVDDDVTLELYLKNVKNLIVKVFEINTSNYYRKYKKEIDTDVNLDGLLPNSETVFEYDEEPAVRNRREFKFPQIKGPGVYVVDFIADGKSSRALIRKGRLQLFSEVVPMGQLVTVVDQSGAKVMDAEVKIGAARYSAMENGKILVPFSSYGNRVPAIIRQGDFYCLQMFQNVAEQYQLKTAMVLDRENLTRSNKARVLIRPSLSIFGGNPVPLSMIKDAKLTVVSTSLDGNSATTVLSDLELDEKRETVCEFNVPPRLERLRLTLTVRQENRSRNKTEAYTSMQNYTINSIERTGAIQDIHLVPTDQGYFLEMLGKTGEARPNQAIVLAIESSNFQRDVVVQLKTDDRGSIELGDLKDVTSLGVYITQPDSPLDQYKMGSKKFFRLSGQDQTGYRTIHAQSGQSIEIPAPAGVTESSRDYVSFFEVRNNTFVSDRFESVNVKDGLVTIENLEPGDYDLRLTYPEDANGTQHRDTKIRITEGQRTDNVLIGQHRHLETRGNKTLHISEVSKQEKGVRIKLQNSDASTRVHVIANRYRPAFDSFSQFAQISDLEPWINQPPLRRSVYMEGRKIGDEYAYILRRKYAKKYPGNMLDRPSLLLNHWHVQDTSNRSQRLAGGTDYKKSGNTSGSATKRAQGNQAAGIRFSDTTNLDFLGDGSVLLANLKPNKAGVISIDKEQLGGNQHVRIIALNAFHSIERSINLPLEKLEPKDSRLAKAFDPSEHFSQSKQIKILKQDDTLVVKDVVSAKFEHYDDLGDVFKLFRTLNPSAKLERFAFILDWPQKMAKEKQELYSRFASHELNYFLMKKDPEFFETVVLPHLKHKRDKTLMDLWLLEEDVSQFAGPWEFARLNAFEKILLSQRLEAQSADIIRHTNEAYLASPTKRLEFDGLFDTSISGLGLERDRAWTGRLGESGLSFGNGRLPIITGGAAPVMSSPVTNQNEMLSADRDFGGNPDSNRESKSEVAPMERLDVASKQAEFLSGGEIALGGIVKGVTKDSLKMSIAKPRKGFNRNRFLKVEQVPTTRTRVETRTRTVPIQRTRVEMKSRTLPDGTVENYPVQVPYTENVTQNYSVQVPYTENVTRTRFDIEAFERMDREVQQLYRRLGPTGLWMESNYYSLQPSQQTPELVRINRFWRDYSNHEDGDFLSPYFPEAHRSFTEMMFALSVLDLPFESPEQKFEFADNSMTMTAVGPTITFHQQVRDAVFDRGDTKVLVSENFFQKNDRFRYEEGVRFDKFVTDEFLAHTLYAAQVVITNPTSAPQDIELLIQVPEGSISCAGSRQTQTTQLKLAAFGTQTFEYSFYFPTAGEFEHYPAHVSAEEKVLAVADAQAFKVIDRAAEVDEDSWEFVSQTGSEDQVLKYLNEKNVLQLDLSKIAFRMRDKEFFQQTIETLRNRYTYDQTLWSYSVMHNDVDSLKEYLAHTPMIFENCGPYFDSEIFTCDPVARNWYQHKEYWPLVNNRAHRVGPQRKILNPSFYSQYRQLLGILANRKELTQDDHLVVTYYMLLQDRIETALEQFENIGKADVSAKIQYDYCDAYLDLYREKPDDAREKALRWKDYPVDHWRNRFQLIVAQVDEIEGAETKVVDKKDNNQRQTKLASDAGSFEVEIDSGKAKLSYQNLAEFIVNYYEIDIELLFSRSPFAQDELDSVALIRPNLTQTIAIEKEQDEAASGKGTHKFEIASEMDNRNVLIEVVAGDQVKSMAVFAHSLDVQTIQRYGQIHVTDNKTNKPVPKSYVKVYARAYDGSIRFHKDGYTDLRGRFDYVSQSNRTIDEIEKFSILVVSEDNGAVIRQAELPDE